MYYKFGLSKDDDAELLANMYSCKCGHVIGLDHLDEMCPICETIVDRARFKKGWFYIKPQQILQERY